MSKHEELIGPHPIPPDIFGNWLASIEVVPPNPPGFYRSLSKKSSKLSTEVIDWLAKRLIYHHYDEHLLTKLKQKYSELGFPQYAEQHRRLPTADKTKKGNAAEVLLIEYIESCQRKELIKAFKLRYNPNVDQAIKGDDVLLVDVFTEKGGVEQLRVFLGESKFRETPTKTVVENICKSLGKDKLPLSYSYLIEELNRSNSTKTQADLLDKFLIREIKERGYLRYAGFLMSNVNAKSVVQKHFKSDNARFILISIGVDDPRKLINEAYKRAGELLARPVSL